MARRKIATSGRTVTKRTDNIADRPAVRKALIDVFDDVVVGFRDQRERADATADYWDAFNSILSSRQFYDGESKIFVPIINTAVEARVTRFANQIFPQAGRFVEVTTTEEQVPTATMALLESYVKKTKLRTQVVPAMIRCGDVEGQYSVYVDWRKKERRVTRRVVKSATMDVEGEELEDPTEEPIEDVEETTVIDQHPTVEVINDTDLLILPVTVDAVDEAIDCGGSVTILRRWSKSTLRRLIREGSIDRDAGNSLIASMSRMLRSPNDDVRKQAADAAGIRVDDGNVICQVYETWTEIKVDGDYRLCRAYYGGDQQILGCSLCPYWCDKVPVLSVPIKKIAGMAKGKSMLEPCMDMQIFANDAVNEGADTAHFSAMPITMTDPEKNPRVGSMILGLAAVWETSPKDTQFAEFPDLWKTAFERVNAAESKIFQVLGVNPAMITQGSGVSKKNQAEDAQEQQVDLLTTADAVTIIEEGILTPMLLRFAEYDAQFRNSATTIKTYGEMGLRARMEEVEPIQMGNRFEFRWLGVEAARNAAQVQQQIAFLNVLKGIPPQMYEGYRLDLAPMLVQATTNVFGPRLGPLTFVDTRSTLSVNPETENEMLQHGFDVDVHPLDNDAEHLSVHSHLAEGGVPNSNVATHIAAHQKQIQMKTMAQAQNTPGMQPPPGPPGAGGPGPLPGSQPMAPTGMKGPAGMLHQDQLPAAGGIVAPEPGRM